MGAIDTVQYRAIIAGADMVPLVFRYSSLGRDLRNRRIALYEYKPLVLGYHAVRHRVAVAPVAAIFVIEFVSLCISGTDDCYQWYKPLHAALIIVIPPI